MTKINAKVWLPVCLLAVAALAALFSLTARATVEYDASGATRFVFSDSGITATEGSYSGYKLSGTALTINEAGTYLISGSCADGSVTVKKGTTGVTLVLGGLSLTSGDTAPIVCGKSTEVTILAASGTTNVLTDTAENNDESFPDQTNAENAVIKCKDGSTVTLCGTGTLNLIANGKNGIKSGASTDEAGDASLTIRDLTLNISAPVNDAINAEQLLNVESGTITLSAADDALHCDLVMNIGADGTTGPTITITDCYEGLEAATLNISSGNLSICASDDCLNAANSDLTGGVFSMTISGGTITAYTSSGDGFDSNGDLTISGGTVAVWSANTADNQPLDADGTLTVSGGTVLAAGGSSGMGVTICATQPYVTFGSAGRNGFPGGRSSEGSTASLAKDSAFTIQNASGNTVYSGTAVCNASYVFFSSPQLTADESYTLCSGDSAVATAAAQTGTTFGGFPGGMGDDRHPGSSDGQTPPVKPDGSGDMTPPDVPDGMMPPDNTDGTPPASPPDGQKPPRNGAVSGESSPSIDAV